MRPRCDMTALVLTQGDPQGIGPELLLQMAAEGLLHPGDRVFVDPGRLARLAQSVPAAWASAGLAAIGPLVSPGGDGLGQYAALVAGTDLVLAHPGLALVTAPIDKAAAQAEGLAYPGHTEYLAARAGTERFAMCMIGPRLRVALVTIHLPLSQVAGALRGADIVRVGELLADALVELGISRPRIGVLALNPHAGERGKLGTEEITIVAPAVATLARSRPDASFSGPLPADTAFAWHAEGRMDAVVAMYHDQGLGPFKLMHFTDGINATLGLPFRRSSPDHGTARDIAGRGVADGASMRAAIAWARGADR
jgi:4-hydroxythreonine-4-phosphate dehydrogenase